MASCSRRSLGVHSFSRVGGAVLPLLLALGCGSTFVPADGSDTDANTDGADSSTDAAGTGGGDPGDGAPGSGGSPDATGGGSSGGSDASGGSGTGGDASGGSGTGGEPGGTGGEASGGTTGEGHDCNPEHILCLPIIAPEPCPEGEAYAVESSCYGPCVPIGECKCESASDCPDPNGTEEYACHGTTDRCGPWLR